MDPKDPKDPTPGNPHGNPPGNPDPNVVALQQKLTERDKELKAMQDKLAELEKGKGTDSATQKAIEDMSATIKTLTGTIGNMEQEKERERLSKAYPDIIPDLLLGKSQTEIESLVVKQRETIQQHYVLQPSSHAPKYASRGDVEKEIDRVTEDKSIPVTEKFVKIRELKNARDEF